MLKEGNFNYVPYIQGVNEDEGALQGGLTVNDEDFIDDLNFRWITTGPNAIGLESRNITKSNMHKGLRKLRRFYFGDEDIGPQHLQNMTDLYSDAWFISGLYQVIRYHSKHAPLYPYVFTKKGALGFGNVFQHFDRPVTSHGDELQYLFFRVVIGSEADTLFSKQFLKLWVSFASTGKPAATWGSTPEWPAAKPGAPDLTFYILDDDTRLDNPFQHRMELWDSLLFREFNDHEAGQDFSPLEDNSEDS